MGFLLFFFGFVLFGFAVNGLVTLILGTVMKLRGKKVNRAELSKKCLNWTMFILTAAFGLCVFFLITLSGNDAMSFPSALFLLFKILLAVVLAAAAIAGVILFFVRWGRWIDE